MRLAYFVFQCQRCLELSLWKCLLHLFFTRLSSFNSDPTTGLPIKSWSTSSNGSCLQKIFFSISSNISLKLPLSGLSCVMYKLMSSCIPFPKSLVVRRYFWAFLLVYLYTVVEFWTIRAINILSKVSIKSSNVTLLEIFKSLLLLFFYIIYW